MKNLNLILKEKQEKYQHYLLEKLVNEYLTGKEILRSYQEKVIDKLTLLILV